VSGDNVKLNNGSTGKKCERNGEIKFEKIKSQSEAA
jgi:hypothetical protein